jgi:hypothetical protein
MGAPGDGLQYTSSVAHFAGVFAMWVAGMQTHLKKTDRMEMIKEPTALSGLLMLGRQFPRYAITCRMYLDV